jgi:hypothetical protein
MARDRVDHGALTANEIADRADIKTAKMKALLHLSSDQEKNWPGFASAMQSMNKKWANLAILVSDERANRPDPVDILQQINDRADARINLANDWKALATASKPLYASLDQQQKRQFSESLSGQDREPVSN